MVIRAFFCAKMRYKYHKGVNKRFKNKGSVSLIRFSTTIHSEALLFYSHRQRVLMISIRVNK